MKEERETMKVRERGESSQTCRKRHMLGVMEKRDGAQEDYVDGCEWDALPVRNKHTSSLTRNRDTAGNSRKMGPPS